MKSYILLIISILYFQDGPGKNYDFFFAEGDSILFYDKDLNQVDSIRINRYNDREITDGFFRLIRVKNEIKILGNWSGEVFQLNGNDLYRIDKTLDHRNNVAATIFSHNDTIMKFGGYGHWDNNNYITYYDSENQEWELYDQTGFIPKGHINGFYSKREDEIIFYGGNYVNDSDRLNPIANYEVVKYNFKTKSFEYLGEVNTDLLKDGNHLIILKDSDYSLFIDRDKGQLVKFNPFENLITEYKLPVNFLSKFNKPETTSKIYNHIYTVSYDDYKNRRLWKNSEQDLFKTKIREYEMFNKPFEFDYKLDIIILLLAIILIYIINNYATKKKIILKSNGIYFKKNFYELKPSEANVLSVFHENNIINTNDLLEVIGNEKISYSYQIRQKDHFIEKLNAKLEIIFKINYQAIIQISDENDKRIKNYILNKDFKKILSKAKVQNG